MVMQTPFERLLADVANQAQNEPLAAFGRLQECYNKSLTDLDVRRLGALAANLGGAGLGRWDDAITFVETLLDHPALEADGDTEHSLWRAIACLQRCAKRETQASEALAKGARNASERARVEALSAQMLAARGRAPEAIPMLEAALCLIPDIAGNDDTLTQVAQISMGIASLGEQGVTASQRLLGAAAALGYATLSTSANWRNRHKGAYHRGNAHILCGEPREALAQVQAMMALEDDNEDAGPIERFFTALLACRAQILRGQIRVASGAFEAASDFARRVEAADEKRITERALSDLRDTLGRYLNPSDQRPSTAS